MKDISYFQAVGWSAALLLGYGCTPHPRFTEALRPPAHKAVETEGEVGRVERGVASYYGDKFHGRRTSSGEVFDQNALTAAHPTLPFGTIVEVTNLANGKTVRVRINDRGPNVPDRVIDLSMGAARRLGMLGEGLAEVEIVVVQREDG